MKKEGNDGSICERNGRGLIVKLCTHELRDE